MQRGARLNFHLHTQPARTLRPYLPLTNRTLVEPTHAFSPSMAAATERFIHLARPLAHGNVGIQTNIAPLSVNIQPQVRCTHAPPSLYADTWPLEP